MDIRTFATQGFVALDYPPQLREAVSRAVDSWKSFCALPDKAKQNLPYSNGSTGVGYELKQGEGHNADRKENFDVTTAGTEWLRQNAEYVQDSSALEFIRQATELVSIMKPTILEFAKRVEEEFGISGFLREVERSEPRFFVRFIHYFGDRDPGEETAVSHVDQSGFTLHLYESAPGLQGLTYDGEWIDMPVSEGETVIIPSMQMQLRSEGKLRALCHRVIANQETAQYGRHSAVCFVQLGDTPVYDKDAHGRLQERTPGFNYELTFDEFKKFFKQ